MNNQSELKKERNICELLAPAGSKEAFIAAVENGADAIYAGGSLFNARMNADNFDMKELAEAVKFAHKRKVKVYITINVLIKDEELCSALEYANKLYEIGVDAVIVQDIGFAKLLREHLPNLELHMSTQATVYDKYGVIQASELGFHRVVPARELSLEEIRVLCRETDTEIEVFCHGAICVCYSGQCQMSRHIGGRSGNRGECAQPCRLPYKSADKNGKIRQSALLSPSDMSMVDNLDKLCEAGVRSLKIEGRMKSPEYVAIVTSIYRKYLDIYAERGSYEVSAEDRLALKQIFNRGFTSAYLSEAKPKNFMSGELSKHKGVKIGKVINPNAGRNLIKIRSEEDLKLGDGVEIRNEKSKTGNIVTYLKDDGDGVVTIGDIKEPVEKGSDVFRISSKEQMEAAAQSYRNKDWHSGKFLRRLKIKMRCSADKNGMINLSVSDESGKINVKNSGGPFECAQLNASDRVIKALKKTGTTPFDVCKIDLHGDFYLAVQISKLNKLRRDTLALFEMELCKRRVEEAEIKIESFSPGINLMNQADNKALELYFYNLSAFNRFDVVSAKSECDELGVEIRFVLPAAQMLKSKETFDENLNIIPYISNVSKGTEMKILNENKTELRELIVRKGIYIGNIGQLKFLENLFTGEKENGKAISNLSIFADYGLNIYNEQSKMLMKKLGISRTVASLEASGVHFGAIPLMTSQHNWEEISFLDRKDKKYMIIKRDFSDQDIIAAEEYADVCECAAMAERKNKTVRIYVI